MKLMTFCMNRSQSLRCRLLALLGGILLVTLLIIGVMMFYFISRNEQRGWQDRQAEAARYAAETVTTFIQNTKSVLNLVGLLEQQDLLEKPQVLDSLLRQNPNLLEIIRVDEKGVVFASAYQDTPLLANLFTLPQSRWFIESQAGQFYLGNVQISADSEPYLIMSIPAPDGGVVSARLRINVLWDVVAALRFGETGQVYVVNPDGQIVAHTEPAIAQTDTSLAGRPEMIALLQAPNQEWNGTYVNFQGTEVIGATAPVIGTRWVVITEITTSEATAVSRTALLLLGGGMAFFGVLVILVTSHFLGRLILQPMEQLRTGAARIGHGDLSRRINLARQDEVGQVAAAFDEMADRLHQRNDQLAAKAIALIEEVSERKQTQRALRKLNEELECRVSERTDELTRVNTELVHEISERKRVEEQIKTSLQEKEVLLKEIHHRVKNNLQVISSLLNLQSGYINDQQALEIFQDSQNRIRSMALIHEKLYQSQDLARIDLAEYIQNLTGYLFWSHSGKAGGISLNIQTDEVLLEIDAAVPCGLILNELVSNSLKHAFPNGQKGEIRIELWADNDRQFTLIIGDNGVGFPQDFDFRNTTSLGLQLVNTLVDQLEGTISLHRNGGTEFEIILAKPE